MIEQAYRSQALSRSKNFKWYKQFREGRDPLSGQPPTSTRLKKKQEVLELYIILVGAFFFLTSVVPELFDQPTYTQLSCVTIRNIIGLHIKNQI